MAFRFLNNAIITGHIDAYCLVCESHLRNTEDVHHHIVKPIHIKNLDLTGYYDKYKDDCIRKVKKRYFCEYCNILLPTAAKVGLHIVELVHVENKSAQHLKRIGSSIIAFDNVLINEKAWNGVKEDTCLICGVEFDNEGIHKTEAMHIINLIQSNIEFGSDNTVYRKIDESSFQCLTCNDVLAIETMATHVDDINHKKLYSECRQAYIASVANEKEKPPVDVSKVDEKSKTSDTTGKEQKQDPQSESEKEIPKPDSLEVKKEVIPEVSAKNPISPTESAKKSTPEISAKNPSTPTESVKKSTPEIKKSEDARPKLEKGTLYIDKEICKALNANNYIATDENGQKWCILCDWTVDSLTADAHIQSLHHQTILKMHKERLEKKKTNKLGSDKCTPAQTEQTITNQILDMLPKLEKNDIIVECKSNVAFCKRCSQVLDFNHLAIENHIIEQHKEDKKEEVKKPSNNNKKVDDAKKTQKIVEDTKKPQSPTTKKAQTMKKHERESESRASSTASTRETDDDIEKLAKANNLTFTRNSNKIYCSACDVHFIATMKKINKHVSDTTHKNNTAMKSTKPSFTLTVMKKAKMKDFITDVVAVESAYIRDVIVNEKYVLNNYSFVMLTKQYRLRCEACEMNLNNEQVEQHKFSRSHHRAMCETMVIVSFESEFIRELRPEVYHCGYCNVVQTGYEDLENHLQSTTHREAKNFSMWRLKQYGPEIVNHRKQHPPTFMDVPDLLKVEIED